MRNQTACLNLICILTILSSAMWGCGHIGSRKESARQIITAQQADSLEAMRRMANDLTSDALAYADSICATLPLQRKAAMLLMPATFTRTDSYTINQVLVYARDMGVGGLVLLKGSLSEAAVMIDSIYAVAPEGMFIAADAENGLKMRFEDAPEFPWNRELGRLSDDQLMYEFGREIARECRVVGINMILGPVMDIVPGENYHGIMGKRSLGSNPDVVADLAIAYSKGVEDGGVLTVAKHFPGHGSANHDSHKALGEVNSSRLQLDSIDLYPFRRYIREGLSGVMVGHLAVTALDTIRRPAIVSPVIMDHILRRQLGFHGLILTDAINMEGAMGIKAWQAIAAGADMVIAPTDTRAEIDAIVEAVKNGNLSEDIVNDRCRRILFYRFLTGANHKRTIRSQEDIKNRVNKFAPAIQDSIQKNLDPISKKI
ncbi:MAG: hypothetical protein K2H35_06770 [Muribaculaceae bacterium]|nr:hypothetical protein [Muribaculaceae bacterium]